MIFTTQKRPKNASCKRIIIVGPYPTGLFISKIIKEHSISPQDVHVVVDESWDPMEVNKISNIIREKNVHLVRTESGNGIVHAKIYFIEYELKNSRKSKRLIIGSANASINAISNNSEAIAAIRLSSFSESDQNIIEQYFESLIENRSVKEIKIESKNGDFKLVLPRINVSKEVKSFLNWIRSGRYFIKYEPDQSFGCLSIKLKKENLPQSEIDKMLKGSIFESESSQSELRYPYNKQKKQKVEKSNWKKYTTETGRGLWISSECYAKKKEYNILPILSWKKSVIDKIKGMSDEEMNKIVEYFCQQIEDLKSKHKNLKKCLEAVNDKKLKSKLVSDQALAKDIEFRNRYIYGYENFKVPKYNEHEAKEVALDLLNSCLIKGKKVRTRTLLAKKINDLNIGRTADEILKKLLDGCWERKKYKNQIVNYHVEKKTTV